MGLVSPEASLLGLQVFVLLLCPHLAFLRVPGPPMSLSRYVLISLFEGHQFDQINAYANSLILTYLFRVPVSKAQSHCKLLSVRAATYKF